MASKQSQRMAARQQLQQRMSQKAEQERRQRTVWWSLGGVGALVALVLIAWIAVTVFSPDDESDSATPGDTETSAETPAGGNDTPIEETVANAEGAAARCDGIEPSGEGATGESSGAGDGQPATDVYLECMSLSAPDASSTAECAYTPTGGDTVPATVEPAAGTQEMTIVTNLGVVTADIDTANAPCTAGSFTHLAGQGYFDGQQCHRLTTQGIYVLQCGDPDARAAIESGNPQGAGMGGPGYEMAEENMPAGTENNYPAGTLAMANAGAGTTGSQFFIVYEDSTLNPASYTILGQITSGLDIVQEVAAAGVM
ncbi:peptidylprolyl isomerase [Glycomyces arizonensis]|uniref:peptidylprolyl isomerase n=1 Tax=Glycomyces arizonensis TaxID=256035 RepID=UPI00040C0393|nr:peptidylprolyl isomerase [Glycomyces arizonensis]